MWSASVVLDAGAVAARRESERKARRGTAGAYDRGERALRAGVCDERVDATSALRYLLSHWRRSPQRSSCGSTVSCRGGRRLKSAARCPPARNATRPLKPGAYSVAVRFGHERADARGNQRRRGQPCPSAAHRLDRHAGGRRLHGIDRRDGRAFSGRMAWSVHPQSSRNRPGAAYPRIVAPLYFAVGVTVVLTFASQGGGRPLWPARRVCSSRRDLAGSP